MQIKPEIKSWQIGQRVARKDDKELGVVVEVDRLGTFKVKWDRGSTTAQIDRAM